MASIHQTQSRPRPQPQPQTRPQSQPRPQSNPGPPPHPPPPAYPASITSSTEIQQQAGPSVPQEQTHPPDPFVTPRSSQSLSLNDGKEGHRPQMPQFTRHLSPSMDYFGQDIAAAHTSLYLLISFFTSGLVDSVVFNSWSCFVGMQTGNTLFAALGLSGQPLTVHPNAYLKSLTSIVAFCLGNLFFSAFHRLPCWSDPNPAPSRRRFLLMGSFTLQTALIIIAGVLVQVGLVSNRPAIAGAFSSGNHLSNLPNPEEEDNYKDLIAIGLLAFQSAGPVFFSRVLGLIELPTIVLSTLYCDFMADLYRLPTSLRNKTSWYGFFFIEERRQLRRLGSIAMLFLGGLVGGFLFKSPVGMVGALWMAAGLKGTMVLGWLFWKSEKREDQDVV